MFFIPKEKGFPAKIKSALPLSVRQGGSLFHGCPALRRTKSRAVQQGGGGAYLLILAHESLSVTVRLKTRCSGVESVSGQK